MKITINFFVICLIIVNLLLSSQIAIADISSDRLNSDKYLFDPLFINRIKHNEIVNSELIKRFYAERSYKLAWFNSSKVHQRTYDLLSVIGQAYLNGLNPDSYLYNYLYNEIAVIEKALTQNEVDIDSLLMTEILLTGVYLDYSSDLLFGFSKCNKYNLSSRNLNLINLLNNAINNNNIKELMEGLYPISPLYERMQNALEYLSGIAADGGWPVIRDDIDFKKGGSYNTIPIIKERLSISGDINSDYELSDILLFDKQVEEAVKSFQSRHGLISDGVINKETVKAMNVPVEERIKQLKINMDRLRWLPQVREDFYLVVNIPEYKLKIISNYSEIFE